MGVWGMEDDDDDCDDYVTKPATVMRIRMAMITITASIIAITILVSVVTIAFPAPRALPLLPAH